MYLIHTKEIKFVFQGSPLRWAAKADEIGMTSSVTSACSPLRDGSENQHQLHYNSSSITGKFNQEPHYFKEFEFPRQKNICVFRHLNKKCATKGLVV